MKKFLPIFFSLFFHVVVFSLFFDFSETFFQESKWKGEKNNLTLDPIFIELPSPEFVEKYRDPVGGSIVGAIPRNRPTKGRKHGFAPTLKNSVRQKTDQPGLKLATTMGSISQRQTNHKGLDKDGPQTKTAPTLLAAIRKKISEKQIYPLQARERGLAGTVKITFRINSDGTLDYTKISSSSGSQILDDSALLAIKNSTPLPYFPHAITLPISYELK